MYFDSMLFVYYIEGHPEFGPPVKRIYERMLARQDILCTSILTIGELLTGPEKSGELDTAAAIWQLVRPPHVELIPFDTNTVARYAKIRAQNNVKPADAIHLACAATAHVNLFLTNDQRLKKLVIPGINFIAGLDVNVY